MQRAAAALHLFPSGLRLPRRQGIVLGHQSVAVLAQALGDGVDDVLAQALFAEDAVGSAGQRQLLILTLEGVGRDGDERSKPFSLTNQLHRSSPHCRKVTSTLVAI